MKTSWRGTAALLVLFLLAWGGWYGWKSWKTSQALNALADVVRSADLNRLLSNPPEVVKNSVDLAVRGITLSQGSRGSKSFDLNADWATLNLETGSITVRDPEIRYFLRSDNGENLREVHAVSLFGRTENDNQHIFMEGDVKVTQQENTLSGSTAVFRNEERTLTFTEGAELDGPELSGHTALLQWNLDTNILTGTGGVRMRWVPRKSVQTEEKQPVQLKGSLNRRAHKVSLPVDYPCSPVKQKEGIVLMFWRQTQDNARRHSGFQG